MSVIVACPECGSRLTIPERARGRQVRCPHCRFIFQAEPAPAGEEVAEVVEGHEAGAARAPVERALAEEVEGQPGEPVGGPAAVPPRPWVRPEDLPSDYRIDASEWFRYASGHYRAVLLPSLPLSIVYFGCAIGAGILDADEHTRLYSALFNIFLNLPFSAGYTAVALAQLRGEAWGVGDFFSGFRRYFTLVGYALVLGLVAAGIAALMGMAAGVAAAGGVAARNPGAVLIQVLIILAGVAGIVYVTIRAGFFGVSLIMDRGMGAMEALRGSWAMSRGHFLGLLGMGLLLGLINVGGVLLLGVGVLFSMPFTCLALNAGYLLAGGTPPPREGPPRVVEEDV